MHKLRNFIHSILRKDEMNLLRTSRKRLRISQKELRDIRDIKFKKLIDHSKIHSPYYKILLQDIKVNSINELNKIPILTKEILKENYTTILCKSDIDFLKKDSTSGSTSEATHFGADLRYHDYNSARLIRANEINGHYKYLDKMLVFWGADRDILDKRDLKNYYNFYIKKIKVISTYHMTEKDIRSNIDFINKWKPTLIVGYSSALTFMADFIAVNPGILQHIPKVIISAGEMLYDVQKEKIEDQFHCEVYNRYGSREFIQIASECSSHKGLHYDAEDLIIEVLDDDGNPCSSNIVGNIVITDLNNFVFPMIRYAIGDRGSLAIDNICECGCTLPKINKLEGRTFDVIHGLNGNNVSGSFWTLAFRHKIKGVISFQVRQSIKDKLDLRIKINNNYNEVEEKKTIDFIQEKLGKEMKVNINVVDEFEYSPTGKFKWVVSDLNRN